MTTAEARTLQHHDALRLSHRTVLLAENDPGLREQLADDLRGKGYEIISVPDGAALVDYFRSSPAMGRRRAPDVVIMELALPGIHGLDACEELRALGARVPVILISPGAVLASWEEAEGVGAAFMFEKPIDLDGLHGAVASLVGSYAWPCA